MSSAAFHRALAQFPIQDQEDLDHAVKNLLKVRAEKRRDRSDVKAPAYPRALALLSYALLTAWQDGWSHRNATAWGNLAYIEGNKLAKRALKLAKKAWKAQEALPAADRIYDYDIQWALAAAHLANGNASNADDQFEQALASGKTAVQADAADARVYLGKLQDYLDNNNVQRLGARSLIDQAVASAVNSMLDAPDWFLWVRAWVSFAEAALANHANDDVAETTALENAIGDLLDILPGDPTAASDFDAYALLAAAILMRSKLPNPGSYTEKLARETWTAFLDELASKRKASWGLEEEKDRRGLFEPDSTNQPAKRIKRYWYDALEELEAL